MWMLNPTKGFSHSYSMPDGAISRISERRRCASSNVNVPEFGRGSSTTCCRLASHGFRSRRLAQLNAARPMVSRVSMQTFMAHRTSLTLSRVRGLRRSRLCWSRSSAPASRGTASSPPHHGRKSPTSGVEQSPEVGQEARGQHDSTSCRNATPDRDGKHGGQRRDPDRLHHDRPVVVGCERDDVDRERVQRHEQDEDVGNRSPWGCPPCRLAG